MSVKKTIKSAKKAAKHAKTTIQAVRNNTLNDITSRIKVIKDNNNGKVSCSCISTIVAEMKPIYPRITRDVINYH